MNQGFTNTLKQFQPISLVEMGMAELMERSDLKFAITLNELMLILPQLANDYRVLEINDKRIFDYDTLYYDTPDHQLYMMHHNGKMNRYKVRRRTYVDSDISFLEAKIKNNKGVTNKVRIKSEVDVDFSDELISTFLTEHLYVDCSNLIPSININYNRIALVNKSVIERVTIDTKLTFSMLNSSLTYDNLVIIEVKSDGKTASKIRTLLRDMNFKTIAISKYCAGMYLLKLNEKRNNFKPQVLQINKLINN